MLTKNQLKKKLEGIINTEYDKQIVALCDPNYYENQYWKYALETHTSVPCIIRTVAEMLVTGSKLYTHSASDLKQANNWINYLNLYSDEKRQRFINEFILDLRDIAQNNYAYLIASAHGRFKDVVSTLDNFREKLLKSEIIKGMLMYFNSLPTLEDLSDKELVNARQILEDLQKKLNREDLIHDAMGYRIIVDSVNSSTDEDQLINFIYSFKDDMVNFFTESGYDIYDEKDYIADPKPKGYQSYHCIVRIMQTLVELQLRTSRMHEQAENGEAAHDEVYKNTESYKFLKQYFYNISENVGKVSINERIGILKSMNISNRPWCFTPNEEIPKTPAELKEFANLDLLAKIHEK